MAARSQQVSDLPFPLYSAIVHLFSVLLMPMFAKVLAF
jgi:hypothetical protein